MPKRKCSFSEDLRKRFNSFRQGRNEYEAECLVCPAGTYVSVANKGALDLESHVKTTKHVNSVRTAESSSKISTFFTKRDSSLEDLAHAAESTLAFHTVQHHQSFKSMDCSGKLTKKLFKDSKIAGTISCARTKTEAIITSVLAPHSIDVTVDVLNGISCFGVATDSSNHGSTKLFPILIQFFDAEKGGITTKVVELKSTQNEKAETIASYVKETLVKLGISDKCVAFAGDNTNTNFGGVNQRPGLNVFTLLKESLNSNLLGAGCPAHVLHNCIQHGLDKGLKLDVESIVLKIFNYFSMYTVRTEELKEFCDFVEIEYRQLLFHSKTRWLSLFPCVHRILQMFPALKSYFLSQDNVPLIINNFFMDKFSEVRLLFVYSLMNVFHDRILKLEKEKNSIAETVSILEGIETILIDRESSNFVPIIVKGMIREFTNEGFEEDCNNFIQEVSAVYKGCINYVNKWLKQYTEFKVFKWMKLSSIPSWEDVEQTISFVNTKVPCKIDDVACYDQFCNFVKFLKQHKDEEAAANASEPQGSVNKKTLVLSNDIWIKYFGGLEKCTYSELLKLVEFFYCIPSHNACVERVFSLINSQWTKERNRLNVGTVKSIVCVQYNFKEFSCTEFYDYISKNAIGSSNKYSWYDKPETLGVASTSGTSSNKMSDLRKSLVSSDDESD